MRFHLYRGASALRIRVYRRYARLTIRPSNETAMNADEHTAVRTRADSYAVALHS